MTVFEAGVTFQTVDPSETRRRSGRRTSYFPPRMAAIEPLIPEDSVNVHDS
jgi:hypothetical protein